MGRPFGRHPAHREPVDVPTKRAALIGPGDVIGYEGEWLTVKTAQTDRGPLGGSATVLTWEEGGTARFPAGDELLLGQAED